MFVALGLFLVVGVGLFALSIGEWCSMPVVELTNVQNAVLTGCPVSSGVTVITTESSRGNINRFPELAALSHSHGSSRNQELDSNRKKDGSERRHRKLVLSPCQSYCWWKAGPDANRFWINASIDLIRNHGLLVWRALESRKAGCSNLFMMCDRGSRHYPIHQIRQPRLMWSPSHAKIVGM